MKRVLVGAFSVFLICFMLFCPEEAVKGAADGLSVSANVILPTLSVFLICSNILINIGFSRILKKPFSRLMGPVFGIGGAGALAFSLGIISGYPVGAICTANLYKNGDITKNEAQRLLGFTNNSGPLFIIGSVGAVMLKNKDAGYLLWAVHVISSIAAGIILRVFSREKTTKTNAECDFVSLRLSEAICEAVKSAVLSVLNISAYTVLFSVFLSALKHFLTNSAGLSVLFGVVEITNGVNLICQASSIFGNWLLCILSFILGFGGLSVSLQVANAIKETDLSLKVYFMGKIMHAVLAFFFMFVLTSAGF